MSEAQIHAAIIDYLDAVLLPPSIAITNNMNPRSAIAGARQKRLRARKGLPDIMVIYASGRVAWIEVKAAGGRLSPEQVDFQTWSIAAGHPHCVARSADDVQAFLAAHQIPNRDAEAPGDAAVRLMALMGRKRAVS